MYSIFGNHSNSNNACGGWACYLYFDDSYSISFIGNTLVEYHIHHLVGICFIMVQVVDHMRLVFLLQIHLPTGLLALCSGVTHPIYGGNSHDFATVGLCACLLSTHISQFYWFTGDTLNGVSYARFGGVSYAGSNVGIYECALYATVSVSIWENGITHVE